MKLRNLLRLRRWALVARAGHRTYQVWSWHLTYDGARRKRHVHRRTHDGADTALWVYPWHKLDDLPGEVLR